METLHINLTKTYGEFKRLNATNGGPWHKRGVATQFRSNLEEYKAARIPYSRNHDVGYLPIYGGPYSHDISCIFPNFDADPYNPASYDFACTDEDILVCLEANTKTFYRLGQTIEHQVKKHGTIPPKDFKKWAVICEHIIRHYTEGWAEGFHHDMDYWEIWNEPDLDTEDSVNRRTWGGTYAQFFDFYETAAKHLKSCFPHLKFGGPALAFRDEFAEEFLKTMKERNVPLDFFSWHIYLNEPINLKIRANKMRGFLDKYGYEDAESICNEWNYIKNWTDKYIYSIEQEHSLKGAAVIMSCMSVAQKNPLDMLMYYDTRPSIMNGVFDFYTARPMKGYYALYWYGMFYDMAAEVRAENQIDNIYELSGIDENGKTLSVITYYSDNDESPNKNVTVDYGKQDAEYEIYMVDEEHNGELIKTTSELTFDMPIHSMILIKEK